MPDSTNLIDAIVVVVYLVASCLIGIAARRLWTKKDVDEENFYLAGREVPAWACGISYAVTAINADVAPLYCGLTAVIGLPIAWFYLSRFAVAWMLVALLFAVRWRQLEIRTGPEFYQLRFGGRGAKIVRVYTALFSVAINMVPWVGAGLLGTHKIIGPVFGIENKATTLAFIVPLVTGYVWVSGFAGVLVTDVFQSSVIILASVVLLGMILWEFGGPSQLYEQLQIAHPIEAAEITSVFPVSGHEILGPLVVLMWFLVPTIGRGGSVDLDGQRLFSCRSAREAAKMTIWGECAMFILLLCLTLPVLGMLATYPELYHASRSDREQIYGQMLAEYLPAGLLGLAVAGVLASVMSTISSYMNYGAQTIVNDFLRPLMPESRLLDPESTSCLWIGRGATLTVLVAGIGVMFAADSLFRIATVVSGMFASLGAFYWAQWWWWRINFWSWLAAMIGGPIVYVTLGFLLPNWSWWQHQLAESEAAADTMIMLQALIAVLLNTAIWVVVTLRTRPETDETLDNFYQRARPLGAWGPVRDRIASQPDSAALPPTGLMSRGIAASLIGAAAISLVVLGLSQLVIGRYGVTLVLFLLALVFCFGFRTLFRRQLAALEA